MNSRFNAISRWLFPASWHTTLQRNWSLSICIHFTEQANERGIFFLYLKFISSVVLILFARMDLCKRKVNKWTYHDLDKLWQNTLLCTRLIIVIKKESHKNIIDRKWKTIQFFNQISKTNEKFFKMTRCVSMYSNEFYIYIELIYKAVDRKTRSNVINSTTKETFISECELIEYNRHTQIHAYAYIHSTHILAVPQYVLYDSIILCKCDSSARHICNYVWCVCSSNAVRDYQFHEISYAKSLHTEFLCFFIACHMRPCAHNALPSYQILQAKATLLFY